MRVNDLWKTYCGFYEQKFEEQMEYTRRQMEYCFNHWRKTDLAKILCHGSPVTEFENCSITTYSDYPMLEDLGQGIINAELKTPKKPMENFRQYYDRIGYEIGSKLNRYMTEPFYICMRSTGTTGKSKWIAHGETFWSNFAASSMATAIIACSDTWGETTLENGDKALNMNAPIPYISGWGALASQRHLKLVPSIEVSDNLRNMQERFNFILKAIRRGEKVSVGGGIGSIFYMICQYFIDPEEFYAEYYHSMNLGLKKSLLFLKLLQYRIGWKEKKAILDIMPLKGVLIAGQEARLYIEFFRKEFNIEPLNIYGSTEAGPLMMGYPDRKADLIPDLRTSYLEFETEDGEMKALDELTKGEVYDLVVTPFGSILFRYDMEDQLRVIDFRDDGMPVFTFEGRKKMFIDIYGYRLSPDVIVRALSKAELKSSDKWAVVKILKPNEHLHFLMEKTWPYSEREAEKAIFNSLAEIDRTLPNRGRTLSDYLDDYKIKKPSDVVKVEYLRPGAFIKYSMIKAKEGSPIGQYKPPKIIPTEKMEIYETLRSL